MIIYGGPLYDGEGQVFPDGAVFIADDKILAAGAEESVFGAIPHNVEVESYDTQGKVIFPGLVNLHHHFYSAFARGLAPTKPVHNFRDCLKYLWWQVDKALDDEAVQLSALISLLDCIQYGVTTVCDHHSSPKSIKNSLTNIAAAVERAGIRATLCYEVSDREGPTAFRRGLDENLAFIAKYRDHQTIRGMLGLHANFTLSEASLTEIAAHFDREVGIHIHCAEDIFDVEFCRQLGYNGPVSRLQHFDLLSPKAMLAHGIHLDEQEWQVINDTGCCVIHNPESNMNNNVGQLLLSLDKADWLGLGTDGMSSNMLTTLRTAFLLQRHTGTRNEILFKILPQILLANNARFAGRLFDITLGTIKPGLPADLVVFDYLPHTPFKIETLPAHLIFGLANSRAAFVMVNGKCLYDEQTFLTLDEELIREEAAKASRRVWEKLHQ